jgi:heptosyltransferase-2
VFNFPHSKILIVRLSSLGDILLATPLIRSLKKENPNLEIHFLLREEYKDVLIKNPYISKLLTLKREYPILKTKTMISENDCDLVIDLQNNFRSENLTTGLNCPKVKFKKLSWQKFLLVKFKINKLKDVGTIPERYAAAIEGLKLDNEGLDLFTENKPSGILINKDNLIGFCPGSRHFTKMWPKEYYIELGKRLSENNFNVVIFGGEADRQVCAEISSYLTGCINLCNENDIMQTAADMKLCKAIVCNDSGLMHAACAVKVPVLAIFGSTVKEFGFVPYGSKNLILENKSLTCKPCSHIGKSYCPKKHFKCMNELTPDLVFNSVIQLIKQP